ncbi:hypothetical protein [Rhizobium sp. RCC_161_2]|uniref:hypothetical protein n=1 Tax=Rhizobium sp. RCC_161_2 TaxID=3239219 RepID=UPI0035260568
MLTRRGLFGLAAGGAVAAPTLLKGEQPFPSVGVIGEIGPEAEFPIVNVQIAAGEAEIKRLVVNGVDAALRQYVGSGRLMPLYESRRG